MKRPPSDLVRLARAFDIPPTRQRAAFAITATFAGLGALGMAPLFIPAAAVLVGLGGFELQLRRTIATGLRELDAWGFPVTGYREWLLAEEPAFEVELRRDVDIEVIARSAAALDSTVVVRRLDDRVFRVVTRRIALPPRKPKDSAVYVGDRRLLRELHAAVLAPLHADVGIIALRMGDLPTISALVPTRAAPDLPAPSGDAMGAFREPAMAASPALHALQRLGTTSLGPARDARRLNLRSERVLHAVGRSPAGVGTVAAITFGGLMSGAQFGPTCAGIGTVVGLIGGIWAAIRTNRRNAGAVARLVPAAGFVIEGYDDWLISGRPVLDVELMAPLDRDTLAAELDRLEAFSVEANRQIRWVSEVTWLSDTVVRIETRPTLIHPSRKLRPFYGGSHIMFQVLMRDVLVPLHQQIGIVAVRMGGYVDRRV
ncbi:MAG TPA: hypothetical protein VFK02_07310 [Kofleriaceae bacterium]|nr:hypothetical protein [Kofleriaceae bacterium]